MVSGGSICQKPNARAVLNACFRMQSPFLNRSDILRESWCSCIARDRFLWLWFSNDVSEQAQNRGSTSIVENDMSVRKLGSSYMSSQVHERQITICRFRIFFRNLLLTWSRLQFQPLQLYPNLCLGGSSLASQILTHRCRRKPGKWSNVKVECQLCSRSSCDSNSKFLYSSLTTMQRLVVTVDRQRHKSTWGSSQFDSNFPFCQTGVENLYK